MKKEIEFKNWINNPKEVLNQLKSFGDVERFKVVQYIYKNHTINYFARIAIFTYPKNKKKVFLTLKKDLLKKNEILIEGKIVIQDEMEKEITHAEVHFFAEMLTVLGLNLVNTREFIKNKIAFNGVVVTIDEVEGKFHLEIESTNEKKIEKVKKLLNFK